MGHNHAVNEPPGEGVRDDVNYIAESFFFDLFKKCLKACTLPRCSLEAWSFINSNGPYSEYCVGHLCRLRTAPGAASQEDFLLDEDDPKLRAVLNGMIAAKKEDKQSETASQTKGWVKLHLGLAEKRIAA